MLAKVAAPVTLHVLLNEAAPTADRACRLVPPPPVGTVMPPAETVRPPAEIVTAPADSNQVDSQLCSSPAARQDIPCQL